MDQIKLSKLDRTHVGNTSRSGLKLKEVLVVPKINKNLLSVSKLAKDNCCTLEFDETNFVVKDKKTRTLLVKGTKRNVIYALEDNYLYALTAAHDWNMSDNMWHTRLGHPSLKSLKFLIVIVASTLVVGIKCLLLVLVVSWERVVNFHLA